MDVRVVYVHGTSTRWEFGRAWRYDEEAPKAMVEPMECGTDEDGGEYEEDGEVEDGPGMIPSEMKESPTLNDVDAGSGTSQPLNLTHLTLSNTVPGLMYIYFMREWVGHYWPRRI